MAAGYAIYGPTTMLVLTLGRGTHGFTLDPMNVCDDHEHPKQTGAPRAEGDPPIDNVSARDTAN